MDEVRNPGKLLAVARVDVQTGGTAFAVSDRLGLTAFHVVGDRTAGTLTHPNIRLVFNGGNVSASVDARSDPRDDVALLRFN